MLNISVSYFNISSKFVQTFVPSDRTKPSAAAIVASVVATCRPGHLFLINSAFSAVSKLRTPNVYCWSRKTLVAIHWRHLRVNLICIKSFCPQKKRLKHAVRYGMTSIATSPYLMFIKDGHNDFIVIKLTAGT